MTHRAGMALTFIVALLLSDSIGFAQARSGTKTSPATQSARRHPPAETLLAQAQDALQKEDYAAAARLYQGYLTQRPDDAFAHFQLGYAYTALHKQEDAQAEYRRAANLDPKMAAAHLNLGLTLLDSDPAAAVEPLTKASDLLPDQARPRFLLGLALERSGQLIQAIRRYRTAEEMEPKNFDVRFALGRTLLTRRDAAKAEQEFRRALELRGNSADAHLALAESLVAQQKKEAAAAEFATYLAEQPQNTRVRIERASLLVDLGRDDDALAELNRAAHSGKETLAGLKLRSQIYFQEDQLDACAEVLRNAIALAPRDADLHARLGHVLLQQKKYAEAIAELEAARRIQPEASDILKDLLAAQYLSGNCAAAIATLNILALKEALPAGSWFLRATCYDRQGEPADALAAYEKFLELNGGKTNNEYFEATARVRFLREELKHRKK